MSAQTARDFTIDNASEVPSPICSHVDKPLPPRPLNTQKRKVDLDDFSVSSSAMTLPWTTKYSRHEDEEINKDLKNKPLPPEPDLVTPYLPDPPALSDEIVGHFEDAAWTDDMDQVSFLLPKSPQPFGIPSDQHDVDRTKRHVWSPRDLDSCRVAGKLYPLKYKDTAQLWGGQHHISERKAITPMHNVPSGGTDSCRENLEDNIRRHLAFNRPSSQLQRTGEALGRGLLSTFFGFDGQLDALNNRQLNRVRYLLTNQPRPDDVIDKDIYPNSCCVWLRNFIVAFKNKLSFDHSRLKGLIDLHDVHRGFGLLWGFLEACGPTVGDTVVTRGGYALNELQWFQDHAVRPTDAEHMLQIWTALKLLLTFHYTEEKVGLIMQHGLGAIQRHLSNKDLDLICPDEANVTGFFEAACMEWQDSQATFVDLWSPSAMRFA